MSEIDWTKPIQTRGGRRARVLCSDAEGDMPIVVLIANGDMPDLFFYVENGMVKAMLPEAMQGPDDNDIVNIPKEHPLDKFLISAHEQAMTPGEKWDWVVNKAGMLADDALDEEDQPTYVQVENRATELLGPRPSVEKSCDNCINGPAPCASVCSRLNRWEPKK